MSKAEIPNDIPRKDEKCNAWVEFVSIEGTTGGLLPCNSEGWKDFPWCRLAHARQTENAARVFKGLCPVTNERLTTGDAN
jgi:hypothetical protein